MARVIRVDGTEEEVFPVDVISGFSLQEMCQLIQCETIDVVSLGREARMVLDNNGLISDPPRPFNYKASLLYWSAGYNPQNPIVGDVLVGSEREIQ